jgi:hypothetical protein
MRTIRQCRIVQVDSHRSSTGRRAQGNFPEIPDRSSCAQCLDFGVTRSYTHGTVRHVMAEPTIICPSCHTEIKLTESLAAPLLEATRLKYERQITQKDADVTRKETDLKAREAAIAREKAMIDDVVAEKLTSERRRIAEEEGRKIRLAYDHDLKKKTDDNAELMRIINEKDEKLTEADKLQAELLRQQRQLDDARRELDVTVEKRVNSSLTATREQGRKEAEEELRLRLSEKDQTIESMRKQLEDAQRKAEQGSQQLQGEVQELELEAILSLRFPQDRVTPVRKGEHGGDIVHQVCGPLGQPCGTILWESKHTKDWSNTWLQKLRDDQREAKADVAVIVSQVLPKGVETFDLVDKIWVTHPRAAVPVALLLRQMLVDTALARQASVGQQTKMELVYQYLTGPQFRQRMETVVEAFNSMQEDLHKEQKVIMKQWAKREAEIHRVVASTVGLVGDLQGIAGKSLLQIEGLEMSALEAAEPEELPQPTL